MNPTPAQAAAELLRRRRARTSLTAFASAIDVPGKPVGDDDDSAWLFAPIETTQARHHIVLLDRLQRVADGEILRLMVFMPPGSAKSTYTSVVFPAWVMGRSADRRMILASYATDIARKQGRRARQIVRSRKFRGIFGAGMSSETSAADDWALTNGSEFMAGGILAGLTGNRAHGIIVDDPVAGREEADSATMRKKTRAAYEDDLLTRLVPGGFVIIVQTRWHEDDLAGGILPEGWAGESGDIACRDGQVWHVLCLPAIAEHADDPLGRKPGEVLWPEWFSDKHFDNFRAQPRTWSALFQQRPTPDTGDFFRKEWLRYTSVIPKRADMQVYGASDYAVTANGGDYTVHVVVGIDREQNLYLLDLWRAQTDSAVWVETWCDLVLKWRPSEWAEEGGQIRGSVGPFLDMRARERQAYTFRRQFPTKGDKSSRAQSMRARMASLGLHIPVGAPWASILEAELLRFPAGVHDDQVDALGLIGQLLDHIRAPLVEPKPAERAVVGYSSPRMRDDADGGLTI